MNEILTPFLTYKIYLSLNLHFTQQNFDATRYQFGVNANEEKFLNSPNVFWFKQICDKFNGEKDQIINAFLAQHAMRVKYGGLRTPKDKIAEEANRRHGRMQAITEIFKDDLGRLANRLEYHDGTKLLLIDLFTIKRGKPTVCHYVKTKTKDNLINPETVCILDRFTGFIVKCEQWMDNQLLFKEDRLFYKKYSSFVPNNPDHKQIILDYFPIG